MSSVGFLRSIYSIFTKLSNKYNKIASDEEKKAETVYFGVYSIITSVLVGGLFLLGTWGFAMLFDALSQESLAVLLIAVLLVIVGIAEIVLFIEFIFGGLLGVYYQFKCNRSAISWVALAVYIATAIGMIVGIIFILSAM